MYAHAPSCLAHPHPKKNGNFSSVIKHTPFRNGGGGYGAIVTE